MQKFVADCEELRNWINEKMLTARDASYDDARSLHSKWQKHQVSACRKSSLYSRYYAEECDEWGGPSPRLSAWTTQLRRNI